MCIKRSHYNNAYYSLENKKASSLIFNDEAFLIKPNYGLNTLMFSLPVRVNC